MGGGSQQPADGELQAKLTRAERERDLYWRLLQLGLQREVEPLLREALGLVVEITGARQGYVEIHDDEDWGGPPRLSLAHGFSPEEVERVQSTVSRGIVAEAVATGTTVVTASALLDPRFSTFTSVRVGKIEAVLCVPIGDDPPQGVLYLQGRAAAGPFNAEEIERAETFARHLGPFVRRLSPIVVPESGADATAPLRQKLAVAGVVGRSQALARVLQQAALVAPLDIDILLTGESGTGKGQLARVIHDNSPRASRPFLELNCAALPENLVESELFGAEPGAHSTATRRIEGKVAAAEGGTLFLDEIGEIPPRMQGALLQLLQSKEYYPLGAQRAVRADLRIIAATNTDLHAAVVEKRFREDLFFRLQVLPVRLPALRERRDDIPPLAAHFCEQACERLHLPRLQVSRNALRVLEAAPWPGNIRQLAHTVQAAAIRCAGAGLTQIEPGHLFPDAPDAAAADSALSLQEATRRFQERYLRQTLEDTGWNVVEAARRLDVSRSTTYNLIRAYNIRRELT